MATADVAALTRLLERQMQAAEEREKRLQDMLTATLGSLPKQSSNPQTTTSSTRQVSAERPILISSATQADFTAWEELWRDYAQCQHLSLQDRETRVAAIRQCLDEDLRRFIRQGTIFLPDNPDVQDVIDAVKEFVRRQRNPLLDRLDFYNRRQDKNESFDSFHTSLKELFSWSAFAGVNLCSTCTATVCNSCKSTLAAQHADLMRDRIICGLFDEDTRLKLLAVRDLTLEKAVELCRTEEAAAMTGRQIQQPSSKVNAVRKTPYQKKKFSPQPAPQPPKPKCPNCGLTAHTKSPCPATGKICNGCKSVGHFQSMCPGKKTARKSAQIGHIKLHRASSAAPDTVELSVQLATETSPSTLSWIPDTGSDVDAIGPQHLTCIGGFTGNLDHDSDDVRAADGSRLQPVGKINATLSAGAKQHATTIHVYEGLTDALLSRPTLLALGFLPPDWPKQVARVGANPTVDKINEIKAELLAKFKDVFDDTTLKPMNGAPMDIVLEDDATPHRVHTARSIPFAYRDQVKVQLDGMVSNGIIEPVTEPSDWCHPIVVVNKKGSSEKRLTVDFKSLNTQVRRPTHPTRTPRNVVANISDANFFTKLDARHGYWQVPLSESAVPLTTFMTPWGRYRYLRNPQGLISAGDEFNRRTDLAFERVPNFAKIVDDCLAYDADFDSHVQHVRQVLTCAREHGITFSPKKFEFGVREVDFCGFHVTTEGFTVDDDKIAAIQDFPIPATRTDLRSFMGLVNQCGDLTTRLAELTSPLRPLLKTSNDFMWDVMHTEAFNATKTELISPSVLQFFQPGQALRLETDASALKGLGYALWQWQDGKWRLIQCGSRYLSDAESRYAIIELELLAVVWAVHKCSLFLSGTPFDVFTDHRPLVPIINQYTLDQIENPRLQRLILKLRPYQVRATWRKGSDNLFADALSRNPVQNPISDEEFGEDAHTAGASIRACIRRDDDGQITSIPHCELMEAARADESYQALVLAITDGFPSYRDLQPSLRPYWSIRAHLSTDSGVVLKGQRIVVPRALRRRALTDLHAAHQGLTRTKARARQVFYWPNMANDIANVIGSCDVCQLYAPSQQKEPMMVTNDRRPSLPFASTSADLFSCQGWEYIVYTDRKTGWPCVAKLGRSCSSADVIRALRRWFPDLGVPTQLVTDGGPQFASRQFADFCSRWQIDHVTSTPHYPQSNGHAEAAVKAMKLLIRKTTSNGNLDVDEFQRGLLEWRNTPAADRLSPAQKLFGRTLPSFVMAHHSSFAPEWQTAADDADAVSHRLDTQRREAYDQHAKSLRHLPLGTRVVVQDPRTKLWSTTGTVVAIGAHRDYYVKLPSGRVFWRNRRFLRPLVTAVPPDPALPTPTPTPAPTRRSSRRRQRPRRLHISNTSGQSYD